MVIPKDSSLRDLWFHRRDGFVFNSSRWLAVQLVQGL